jgi:hypothetical protein
MADGFSERDRGLSRILDVFRKNGGRGWDVRIGVQRGEAAETHEGGLTNAQLAAIHEFGFPRGEQGKNEAPEGDEDRRGPRIPSRPFLRGTFDREKRNFEKMMDRAARRVADGRDVETELGVVGEHALSEVVRTIDEQIGLLDNADSTIRRKKSSKPLIGKTGQLKQSITVVVEREK